MRPTPLLRQGPLAPICGLALLLAAPLGCAGPEDGPAPQQPAPEQAAAPEAPAGQQQPARAGDPPPEQPGGGVGKGALDELAKQLTLEQQEKKALSDHYFAIGLRHYEAFDYRKAAENFERALDATPNDPRVRQYLLQAQLLGGLRQAEFETIPELLKQQREVQIDLERAELKRIYLEGEKLLDAHEYEKAISRFEVVLEKIRWFPYKIDTEQFEQNARRYIVQARRQLREQRLAEKESRERRAIEEATLEEQRARDERRQQVRLLLQRAIDQLTLKQWKAAERTTIEVLEKDPGNEEAIKLRELAINGRHTDARDSTYEANRRELRDDLFNTGAIDVATKPDPVEFPDKTYWTEIVRERTEGIADQASEEPQWIREYRNILASRRVVQLNFDNHALPEVITFLADMSGLNIILSPKAEADEMTVTLRVKDIPLGDVLKIILEQTELAMIYDAGSLIITKPEEARGEYYLQIYSVGDLLSKIPDFPGDKIRIRSDSGGGGAGGGGGGTFSFDDEEEAEGTVLEPDKLKEIVEGAVGDVWEDPATVEVHKGQMIVNQTREIHTQIRQVLKNLRRNTGLFVQVEARFIALNDDFLQDIGVDLRGLGLSSAPNIPTPVFGFPQQLDAGIPTSITGNKDIGFGRQIPAQGNARASRIGPAGPGGIPFFGSGMLGGRTEHILNGGPAYFGGDRLNNAAVAAGNNPKGLAFQASILDPFQVNAIIRAEEESGRRKIVQAPVITAANRQRVHVSVITQRAYIADYELSSGGTGLVVAEVADPIIETFQEGVVLDVRPTISADRKYITLDVRPTLATLVGGSFRQIAVNLGTISNAAINVNIEVPQVLLQEAFTSVTIPDGGTALLGGFRKVTQREERAGVPFLDRIPILNKLFHREAELNENFSLLVLLTGRMISLRDEEAKLYNVDKEE